MCKVITVSNQKGGTAKTTSCVNLGIGLASAGKKVLLIDTDPQGSLSISLGYPEPDEMENTLATLMMNIVNDEEFCLEDVLIHHEEGVDILPSNIELSAIEVSLVNVMSRELILKQLVDRVRDAYYYRLYAVARHDDHKCTCMRRCSVDTGAGCLSSGKGITAVD